MTTGTQQTAERRPEPDTVPSLQVLFSGYQGAGSTGAARLCPGPVLGSVTAGIMVKKAAPHITHYR